MKINTNSFGNYNTVNVNKAASQPAVDKTNTSAITDSEKKFFASMYPDKKNEIVNYEFYNPKGKSTGVTVGSLIDRRG
ncbi:MAG: hypothetical protein RDU14_09800 [Melioribacteraceae bacterium]|nr:hypothetical protein [Melioribacteraceae bacterium]